MHAFFRDHLGHSDSNREPWDIWKKIEIKRVEPLPHMLTRKEVDLLLSTFHDGRYRAYFTLVYQCGLRMSEALAIEPKHINGEGLVIRIVNGKGRRNQKSEPPDMKKDAFTNPQTETHRPALFLALNFESSLHR